MGVGVGVGVGEGVLVRACLRALVGVCVEIGTLGRKMWNPEITVMDWISTRCPPPSTRSEARRLLFVAPSLPCSWSNTNICTHLQGEGWGMGWGPG